MSSKLGELFQSEKTRQSHIPTLNGSLQIYEDAPVHSFLQLDPKPFFLLVKSKLNRERLDEVFIAMNAQEQPNDSSDSSSHNSVYCYGSTGFHHQLQASLLVFAQMIGPSQEPSPLSGAILDNDHDNEERAQPVLQPGPSERQVSRSVNNWMKKAFGYVWSKPFTK